MEAAKQVKPFLDDGRFVPLAALGEERVEWLPEVPTLAELGFPDATIPDNRWGLYGPEGLPDSVVGTLEDAFRTCVQDDDVVDKIGADFVTMPFSDHEKFGQFLTESEANFKEALESSG